MWAVPVNWSAHSERVMETTILQTCAYVGSYAAIWEVNSVNDVLNHCSCRNKHVPLPKGSRVAAPRAKHHPANNHTGILLAVWWVHTTSQGSRKLAESWWQSQSNLTAYCRLQVLLCVPDVLCKGTGGPELDQSHPALSHYLCGCISSQVWADILMLCRA